MTPPRKNGFAFKPGHGTIARKYGLDDLILPKEDADKLLNADLREHEGYARSKLRKAGITPDSLPLSVRKLILDLQFNNGLSENARKELFDAVKERNWPKVKTEAQKFKIDKKRDSWRLEQVERAIEWNNNKGK